MCDPAAMLKIKSKTQVLSNSQCIYPMNYSSPECSVVCCIHILPYRILCLHSKKSRSPDHILVQASDNLNNFSDGARHFSTNQAF